MRAKRSTGTDSNGSFSTALMRLCV